MSKIDWFSCKLFGIVTVLFCCTNFDCMAALLNLSVDQNKSIVLCTEGEYLARCRQKEIGTYWLKWAGSTIPALVFDYYSYGLPDSDPRHITNLRKFFTGEEKILYRPDKHSETDKSVAPSDYTNNMTAVLNRFCTSQISGQTVFIGECKKCPNNAKVSESTVDVEKYREKDVFLWHIHTIADCYLDEFSDNTGTYIYVPNVTTNSNAGTRCYYSNNVHGDELD